MRKTNAPTLERDDVPRVTITLTDETCWLTRHDRCGAPAATYPVDAASIANAFNQFGACTGLLAPETLFWRSRGGQLRIGIWIEPRKHTIHLRTGARLDDLLVPLPGCVFVGSGTHYQIFAATQRPVKDTDPVCQCPLPNVYPDGHICAGSVPFPKCAPGTIGAAAAMFFESEFNHDLAGQATIELLKILHGQRTFPLDQLRRVGTIGEVMADRRLDYRAADDDDNHEPYVDGIDPYEYAYGEMEPDDDDDEDE
jgi:hypothetical protein